MPDLIFHTEFPGIDIVIPEARAMEAARAYYEKRLEEEGIAILKPRKSTNEDKPLPV